MPSDGDIDSLEFRGTVECDFTQQTNSVLTDSRGDRARPWRETATGLKAFRLFVTGKLANDECLEVTRVKIQKLAIKKSERPAKIARFLHFK